MEGYVRAWESNDPKDIEALFTEDARYFTAPFREPWVGHEEIARGWTGVEDEPGTWSFRYEVLGTSEELAFVRGWTEYVGDEPDYSNLWVIRLTPDGRCSEFIEWWMKVG